MIGASRETVTRLLAQLKKHRIAQLHHSMLLISDKRALEILAKYRLPKDSFSA